VAIAAGFLQIKGVENNKPLTISDSFDDVWIRVDNG
jgi:hypothetical protein